MQAVSELLVAPNTLGSITQAAYRCPNCHRINLAYEQTNDYQSGPSARGTAAAQAHEWGEWNGSWLPKLGDSADFEDVPEHIAAAASEATLCLSMSAYRAVGALARAVIEATAKDKQVNGSSLAARINALADAGHIRAHTRDQAHEVRYFGNEMAHGDFADATTAEAATEIVALMSEVLNEVYQSPARLNRVREAREAKRISPPER